ncbi:MAG TPA: glycosyltransferase family 4 protein [Candidatus Saccharimonadales bacterium]
MKILMLGWELPPHNSGGLGVACYQMSKALATTGAAIDFVVPYDASNHTIDFMQVHGATNLAPYPAIAGAYDSWFPKNQIAPDTIGQPIRTLQAHYLRFVESFVGESRPDVIHAHDWLTMEAGLRAKQLTGAPLIVHVHATEFDRSGEHYGNPLVHDIERMGLHAADKIIAVSNITKKLIVEQYNIPANKIEVAYNAVESINSDVHTGDYQVNSYTYLEEMKRDGYVIVVTLGRLTVQKGLRYFLEAAARASSKHDKLLFVIAGSGEQRDELIMLAADLGIADRVFFTGFVRGKQWRDAYTIADIFVMSSVSEPFGLTALEAAAQDTAIVLSRQSGVGEVLQSVLRCNYWETDRLADQLVGIALSPSLSYELRKNVAREYARITWADIAKTCLGVYDAARRQLA